MSDITAEEFLEHFGVRGMKWGVKKGKDAATGAAYRGLSRRNETLKNKREARAAAGGPSVRTQARRQLAGRIAIAGLGGAAAGAAIIVGARYAQDGLRTARFNALFREVVTREQTNAGRSHVTNIIRELNP